MRISSINVAQPRNVNYRLNSRRVQTTSVAMPQQQPSFKGWKAGLGGIVGTVIGGGVAAFLSGGALLPVLLASACGTTGGCIYGSTKEDHNSDDYYPDNDTSPCYPNYRDY